MKYLQSSDINLRVHSPMNNPAVRVAMPLRTALIWGLDTFPGANQGISGTSSNGGVNRRQDLSAIWGTRGADAACGGFTGIEGER
jgi:hypothetical protein